jgi:hypothetical protein
LQIFSPLASYADAEITPQKSFTASATGFSVLSLKPPTQATDGSCERRSSTAPTVERVSEFYLFDQNIFQPFDIRHSKWSEAKTQVQTRFQIVIHIFNRVETLKIQAPSNPRNVDKMRGIKEEVSFLAAVILILTVAETASAGHLSSFYHLDR